jgi:hypothetical protein
MPNSAHLPQLKAELPQRLGQLTDELKASYAICLLLQAYPQLRFLSQTTDKQGLKFVPVEWSGSIEPDEIDFWQSLSQPDAIALAGQLIEEINTPRISRTRINKIMVMAISALESLEQIEQIQSLVRIARTDTTGRVEALLNSYLSYWNEDFQMLKSIHEQIREFASDWGRNNAG